MSLDAGDHAGHNVVPVQNGAGDFQDRLPREARVVLLQEVRDASGTYYKVQNLERNGRGETVGALSSPPPTSPWLREPEAEYGAGAGGPPRGASPGPSPAAAGGPGGLASVASAAEGFVPSDDHGSRYLLRRYLLWGRHVGGRRPWVNESDFTRRGSMEADRHLAAENAKAMRAALGGLEGRRDGSDVVARLNAVLRGEVDADRAGIPADAAAQRALKAVEEARFSIDKLSTLIAMRLKGQLPESLGLVTLDNRGKYVLRAYEKFANRNYRPADEVVGDARAFLADQLAAHIDAWEQALGGFGNRYSRESFRRKMAEYIATGNEDLLNGTSGSFQHRAHRGRALYEAASKRLNGLLGIRLEDGRPKLSMDVGDAVRLPATAASSIRRSRSPSQLAPVLLPRTRRARRAARRDGCGG